MNSARLLLLARVAALEAGACPLRLELDGVHAIDAQTALVYGDIDEASAFRSVLLRSAAGGALPPRWLGCGWAGTR
jgi:hypothetical protein